jgi:hypothetical protein
MKKKLFRFVKNNALSANINLKNNSQNAFNNLTAISEASKAENRSKNRKTTEELHHLCRLLASINESKN